MRPLRIFFTPSSSFTYVASGGVVFGGAADTENNRDPITYSYTPTGGLAFGGSAQVQISKNYNASGGFVFGGTADIVADVTQIAFDIFQALNSPRTIFFDIISSLEPLNGIEASFDIYEGVAGAMISFDIYSERLRTARFSEDVQMPVAEVEIS